MKITSLAVLALIGDEYTVRYVHAKMEASAHEIQSADYYDRSFEEKEAKEMADESKKLAINKWDGLIHAQNGKVYDPATMKEVELETTDVQLDETFSGEPIGIVQQRIGLMQTQSKDWYDDQVEKEEAQEMHKLAINKWDGLVHAANGKVYDQQTGKEVAEQLSQKSDWCDSGIKGTNWCAQEEAKDLNERTPQQRGLMFAEREYNDALTPSEQKDWCDSGIKGTNWCA
jgi:hypothetical protein